MIFFRRCVPVVALAALAAMAFEISQSASASSGSEHPRTSSFVGQVRPHVPSGTGDRRPSHHGGIAPGLRRQFRVFRQARNAESSSGQALPPGVVETMTASNMTSGLGLEPTLAQFVTVGPGFHVWLVPGVHGMCVIVPESPSGGNVGEVTSSEPATGGEVCGTAAKATSAEVLMREINPETHETVVVGLLPDNANVTLVDSSGATQAPTIGTNVYMTRDQQLSAVRITFADGTTHTIAFPQP